VLHSLPTYPAAILTIISAVCATLSAYISALLPAPAILCVRVGTYCNRKLLATHFSSVFLFICTISALLPATVHCHLCSLSARDTAWHPHKPNGKISRFVKLKLIYDRQSVGQSVLVSGAHLGPLTNCSFFSKFPSDSCVCL
jgi:hypothetical protein